MISCKGYHRDRKKTQRKGRKKISVYIMIENTIYIENIYMTWYLCILYIWSTSSTTIHYYVLSTSSTTIHYENFHFLK